MKRWWNSVRGKSKGKLRNYVLFNVGLILTIDQSVFQSSDRPGLYILYGGMMGLPFVLGRDESNRGKEDE